MGLGISLLLDGSPSDTLAGAASVEVTERVCQPTSYRIEYALDISDSDFPLLKDDAISPGAEISLLVPTTDKTYCLVKGPVYGHDVHFAQGGSGSTLSVLGSDSLIRMDREDKVVQWS